MHVDSGCRADASEAAIILLPSNITVFALDFSGSGLSGGEHVTLGWNEVSGNCLKSLSHGILCLIQIFFILCDEKPPMINVMEGSISL